MLTLKATKRDIHSKTPQKVRAEGFLPSVVYGPSAKNEAISVSLLDFQKIYKEAGESSLIQLDLDSKKVNVLIHDIEQDPITLRPIHADFYAVDMKKEIHAKIPLIFIGESPAVKAEGALILKVLQELDVTALPEDLPREISVNIELLAKTGDRLTIAHLSLPKGVKTRAHAEDIVAIAEAPRVLEESVVAAVTEGAVTEVKTEAEVKKAEKEAKQKAAETAEGK